MSQLKQRTPVQVLGQDPAHDDPCELFHEQTKMSPARSFKDSPRIGRYLSEPRHVRETAANFKLYSASASIALPEPPPLDTSLARALRERKSTRTFSGAPVTLVELASTLHHAVGATRSARTLRLEEEIFHFRPYPSGGGLYPVEIYVLALNVEGVAPCVAHYHAATRDLRVVAPLDEPRRRELQRYLLDDPIVDQAGFGVVATAVLQRSTIKYGARGYRLALIEAGHVGQNLALAATAQGLGNLAWGGYWDDHLAAFLGVDPVSEPVVHMLFVGRQDGDVGAHG